MGFMSVAFFLGLASLFVGMGASASYFGGLLREYMFSLTTAGGVVVVIFGIMTLFGKGFSGAGFQGRPASTFFGFFSFWGYFCFRVDSMCRSYSFRNSYSGRVGQNDLSRNGPSVFLRCWFRTSIDFDCNTMRQFTQGWIVLESITR